MSKKIGLCVFISLAPPKGSKFGANIAKSIELIKTAMGAFESYHSQLQHYLNTLSKYNQRFLRYSFILIFVNFRQEYKNTNSNSLHIFFLMNSNIFCTTSI